MWHNYLMFETESYKNGKKIVWESDTNLIKFILPIMKKTIETSTISINFSCISNLQESSDLSNHKAPSTLLK